MTELRNRLANLFAKLGGELFGSLSGLEERRILPKAARWLKLSLLGLFVALVSSLSLEAKEDVIMCYKPAPPPLIELSKLSVRPNPTKGADSVTVKATARISEHFRGESTISSARMRMGGDTIYYPMRAIDGKFDAASERIVGRLYVGNIEPETTYICIEVENSSGQTEIESLELVITEPD
ncbi:hypothetical protein GX441_00980 [bacterium]|nr:hypothetical protein [bacterium]